VEWGYWDGREQVEVAGGCWMTLPEGEHLG